MRKKGDLNRFSYWYHFIGLMVKPAFKLYYRNLDFKGLENIDFNKPTIFVANHRNAFIDPILIAFSFFKQKQTSFMVRQDVFNHPIAAKILTELKLIPAYRLRDGYDQLEKNKDVFNYCSDLLKLGQPIIIFPEATHWEKEHLRPLKKGICRIVERANEQNTEETVQIIPVGIHYTRLSTPRGKAMIQFGEAISTENFLEEKQKNQGITYKKLIDKIKENLLHLMLHVPTEINDVFKKTRDLNQSFSANEITEEVLAKDKEWVKKIALLSETQQAELLAKNDKLQLIFKKLKIDPALFYQKEQKGSVFKLFYLILVFPFALLGFVGNFLPWYSIRKFTNKKINDIAFHSSIKVILSLIVYPVYSISVFVLTALVFNFIVGLGSTVALILLSVYYPKWKEAYRYETQLFRSKQLKNKAPEVALEIEKLMHEFQAITTPVESNVSVHN